MRWYVVVPFAVLSTLATAEGIAAITTGWVLPWLRNKVSRPRLWGYASLLMAACLALQMFDSPKTRFPFGDLGVTVGFVGLVMMVVARRPAKVG
ncbi:hypothetical protein ACFWWB_05085 [Streptomyces sp. NPDC058690]|uniref:hypothetical protein n=1 Tax=Streptomyces sp. NPDC058690 TaxID=3346600 RepID=UPI0036519489